MGKYFGTDGVRGVANQELTPELAYSNRPLRRICINETGRETHGTDRHGYPNFRPYAGGGINSGAVSIGANVVRLGVVTTPCVAYLTRVMKADAGVMISASHNPVEDNGIKFFGSDGFKLSDETELEIERLLDEEQEDLPRPVGAALGTVTNHEHAKFRYLEYLKTTVKHSFKGTKIVMDCANGAAYELAPMVFRELGAEVITIHHEPDGLNINLNCGSTHPEQLKQEVVHHKADFGLSYDGDADRLIAVDEKGEEVDGDYILSICGADMDREGRLNHRTIVSTVMSNLGFYKALEGLGSDYSNGCRRPICDGRDAKRRI